ncbi:hypothetical protein J4408_01490 [Candidatus Pacearchaeota archaeon]|nr:hypothetical protein [Candidatus Pacearchaeota archaeon]
MRINKKGQEEIVGFVLVIVLVAVIFLIFVGIFVRQDSNSTRQESIEVYQFLDSFMQHTSECAIGFEPAYSNVGELIQQCYSNSECTTGKSACSILNDTLEEILDLSWNVGEDRPIKGYIFEAKFDSNLSSNNIIEVKRGECGQSVRGSEYLIPAFPGTIVSSFNLCF